MTSTQTTRPRTLLRPPNTVKPALSISTADWSHWYAVCECSACEGTEGFWGTSSTDAARKARGAHRANTAPLPYDPR